MLKLLAPLTVTLLLSACAAYQPGLSATAHLVATTGNTVSGIVHFTQMGDKVLVTGDIKGLKPDAVHGFHIHEKGDCSSGDGVSAGGHFNPVGKPHGAHDQAEHHAGDLPSLTSDGAGAARLNFETGSISVGSGLADVVGRGLIVHRDPDDFRTQPTGNSGPRLACAAILKS
ncbi:MAG: superoxide dismutase family protein [Comamonadaceae bacterium]